MNQPQNQAQRGPLNIGEVISDHYEVLAVVHSSLSQCNPRGRVAE